MEIFNIVIVYPVTNLLVAIYKILEAVGVPSALGFAIILLTIAIRFILYPLTASQLKASKKMQDLHPHLTRIKAQHKNDATRLQQETMQLYKEHGVNPIAGCLPLLVQLPLLWGLYHVLGEMVKQTSYQNINKVLYFDVLKLDRLWDTTFFGLPLAKNPSELFPTVGVAILLIPLLTGVFQFLQSKMMTVKPAGDGKKKSGEPDMASAMQTNMLYVLPVFIGFMAWSFPVGLSLYWNTFSIFGMIQQYKIQGWGGASEWVEKIKGNKVKPAVQKKVIVAKQKPGKKKHGR